MKKNRIEFAEETNMKKIKSALNIFFGNINKVNIAVSNDELTPGEIVEICNSFIRKFDIISDYARAEINKRKDDDKKTV